MIFIKLNIKKYNIIFKRLNMKVFKTIIKYCFYALFLVISTGILANMITQQDTNESSKRIFK